MKGSIKEYGIRSADGSKELRIEGLRLRTPLSALFNPILTRTLSHPVRRAMPNRAVWHGRTELHSRRSGLERPTRTQARSSDIRPIAPSNAYS
jgi:hypothetical protein